MLLHHGSACAVTEPRLEKCRPNNDYGQGFYCTQHKDLAGEWACQKGHDGFVSSYEIDIGKLNIVDLNSNDRNILNWLAVLLENRLCRLSSPTMRRGARWLLDNYSVDLSGADIVKGYRADDSYFGFARAFLRNEITVAELSAAMRLGELGEQYMLKSPAAFEAIHFLEATPADSSRYWPLREKRDIQARAGFERIIENSGNDDESPHIAELMKMTGGELDACLS